MNNDRSRRTWNLALAVIAACIFAAAGSAGFGANDDDETIALHLAELLRSARAVISQNQTVINDPALGDKGLTGERVLADALIGYKERTGEDPAAIDPASREGQLLQAQMEAISEVMAENQDTINARRRLQGLHPRRFRAAGEREVRAAGRRRGADQGDGAGEPDPQPQGAARTPGRAAVHRRQVRQARMAEGRAFSEVDHRRRPRRPSACSCPNITRHPACPATASRPARWTSPAIRRRAARRATSARRSASPCSNDHRQRRAPDRRSRWPGNAGRAGRHRMSIPLRLAAIVGASLIAALIATNVIVIRELNENSGRMTAATELFERARGRQRRQHRLRQYPLLADRPRGQPAHHLGAQRQRGARGARHLPRRARRAQIRRLAADIGRETDAYMAKALEAVDAYTDDNRVIGNTLLAQAREHSRAGRGAPRRADEQPP